jgi:hypothetical protein
MAAKEEPMGRGFKTVISWGLLFSFFLFMSPQVLPAQTSGPGNLLGFVYDKDGSTPVAGAVIFIKNVTTGSVHESKKSDAFGVFKFEGLTAGIYSLGVSSNAGNYNSPDLVGVTPDETAKLSIVLNPYDNQVAQAAQAVAKNQKEKGESFIGRVVKYVPQNKEAEVFVEQGLLQAGDRIRVKGGATDFYQDARLLRIDGVKTSRIVSGQNGILPIVRACAAGDRIYIVCKRGVPPFFLAPLGLAAIVAGSAALVTIEEEQPVSPVHPIKIKG